MVGSVYKKAIQQGKYEMVRLGDICECYQPKTITGKEITEQGEYKVYGANGVIGYYDEYNHEEEQVAVTCRGATCGSINFTEPKSWITGNAMICKPKSNNIYKKYLYYILHCGNLSSTITGSAQPQITKSSIETLQIPLPPLVEQQKIVDELDRIQKSIQNANDLIKNLKVAGGWYWLDYGNEDMSCSLNEICEINPKKPKLDKNLDI